MKRVFTLASAVLMLLAFFTQPLTVKGQTRDEVVAYTLDGNETGGTNNYATESEITQGGITWMITGNTMMAPWRIGGKNLEEVDRPLYSTGTLSDNITKVVVTHGTASNITVNSMTLIVSANADFSNPTSTLSAEFAAEGTNTFNRPTGADWTNQYYKLVYNVSVSGNSNKFVQFISAEFYMESGGSGTQTVATPTFSPAAGTYTETQTVSISCSTQGATIHYTLDGTTPTVNSTTYSTPLTISETTTVKAMAVKAGMNNSAVASATYTIQELTSINTIAGLWDFAETVGTTATAASVTFDNWYVTGVRNNQVCVSDGQYGFVIYQSAHGFAAGDKLNGTFTCNVLFFQNRYAEITGVKAENLTVTHNQEMPMLTTTIGALQTRNYGTPIDLGTLSYDGTKFEDESGTPITPYNNFNLSPNPITDLESGKQYNVKGVYIIYWNNNGTTQQIAPRSADDFEEVTGPTPPAQTVATPTFNPAAGTYTEAQTVSISCTTEGATIHYTLDDTNPTVNSAVYSTPITISETTTVKAFAVKEGLNDSEIATAVYTINDITPITIAEARALEVNEYALVQGVVTFLDGRNVYIQDATAGIDLFLNNNTVPEALAIGDMVQAYGKVSVYKGLVELSGINGSNANEFSILSSGNTLPLAVKTIAEIMEDFQSGANMLQSTRVKIVEATIGEINNTNNTPITQGQSTLNIYKMPVVDGLLEGDIVTVIGIVGCFNNPQLRVATAADVTFTHPVVGPSLTVNPTSLSGFTYAYEAGPSTVKTFTINGVSLSAPTHIYAPEHYEMSSFPGQDFYPETQITISPSSGAFEHTIKVRLKAGLEVGNYNETIVINQEEIGEITIALSGNVTGGTPPQPPTGDYAHVVDLSQLTPGSKVIFAARFDGNANDYYAMTAQASGKPEGVLFTSVNDALPSEILDAEDTFYWTVDVNGANYTFTNADGDVLGYSSSTNFATGGDNTAWAITFQTSGEGAMVPNYSGFVVNNVNNDVRAIALNSNHNFGPYHTQNMGGEGYNFFLDLFATVGGGTLTCATPTFTPESGTYYETQEVAIACATAGVTIYYTLDGTEPTQNSLVYNDPIVVSESTTIKAIAMKEGYENSNIATAEYTIILGAATIFSQDWEGDMNGWTFVTVDGIKPWVIAQYQGNHYAYGNGYNGGANVQWCISPAFDLNTYSNVTLSFRNAKNYTGPDMELYFSNDYDGSNPSEATWTELEYNKSTGSFTWAESGVIDLAGFAGSNCYIGFKYISTEDAAAAWEVDDVVLMGFTSDSYLNVTPNTLSGFTHLIGEGPSASQYFTLIAGNITPAPGGAYGSISLTTGSPFSISLDDEDYGYDIFFEDITNLEPTIIYVRMDGEEVGQYSGQVSIYASSGNEATVTLSGTVTEPIPGGDWNRIGSVADLHNGDQVVIASRYDATVGNGYYAMTAEVSGKPDGVLFTSVINEGVEALPDAIVADIATFMWNVTVSDTIITLTNAAGAMLGYNSSTNFAGDENTDWAITFSTAGENAMVPNYSGFVITNVTTTNRGIAKNANNKFGAYSTSNINNGDYNFYLDLFVLGGTATQTVATPVFSMNSGTYYEEIDVEISCATEGATIYFTNDGSEPTSASTVYSGPIHVASNVTLKAIAMMEGYENSGIATANYQIFTGLNIVLHQDWEGDMNGWTFITLEGNKPWNVSSYGGNHYAYANGYNDDSDNEQWCISPSFSLSNLTDVVLTFRNSKNYNGPDLELFVSNNYNGQDPTTATWTPLPFEMSTGGYAWTESGEISLDDFSGQNCNIAFRYISTLDEGAAAWEVDDILITGTVYEAVDETTLVDIVFWTNGEELFIDNQTQGNVQLTVFNLMGQQVYTKTIGTGSVRFSHNLAKGMYVVTLQNAQGLMSAKMIVR